MRLSRLTLGLWLALVASGCGEVTPTPPSAVGPGAGSTVNASQVGQVQPEPATFHSLGVRWPVRGDANRNATTTVRYRRRGDTAWRDGLPLFRTDPESVSPENRVPGGWLLAGSVVDLVPDTEYDIQLSLRDPDGGDADQTLVMRTLAEPTEPSGMRVRHVVPFGPGPPGTGPAENPFRGLKAAQAAAEPGDLFLLRAGLYAEGTWVIDRHGRAGRPIIYRAAGPGDVVLDGGGAARLISAQDVQHVWFEGLTLRNARYLFIGHRGAHIVIRRSSFEVIQGGVEAINGGYDVSRGFVITDNVFRGPTSWPPSKGIEDINGITITGAGHVVAYNRMMNLGDGVHGTSHGRLSASDIYNNDIEASTDDGIEADYADTNVRVFRNRVTTVFTGISAQPSHGGPLYIFRNAIYNVKYSPFKLHNDTSGVLIFHNTSVTSGIPWHIEPGGETVNDVVTRNNLFIGTTGPALRSTGRMIRCDFDRDGFAWFPGSLPLRTLLAPFFATWNGRNYATPNEARRSGLLYKVHGAITLPIAGNFASGLTPPADYRIRQPASLNDPRLAAESAAVDAGVVLPNFSDGFAGRAPDLGCCELGAPLPHYGPRPTPR